MWPNPQEAVDLVTFTEEILNEKLHFLCSAICLSIQWLSLLLNVCTIYSNFDVKNVFWSSKVGKAIRACIAMVSGSDLNTQLLISLVISSAKRCS